MEKSILIVEEIGSREPVEVARLDKQCPVEFGREPGPAGVALDFQAVSRVHGRFVPIGSYWSYQDLGSTNGSWLNGDPVPPHTIRLVRSGDMIQLADAVLRVTELSESGLVLTTPRQDQPPRSLIVLDQDRFVAEYPVPDFGRALVVGGPGANLEIEGVMSNSASLIVERKGMFTSASGAPSEVPAILEGRVIADSVPLSDGQQITLGNLLIIYSEPVALESSLTVTSGSGWSTSKSATELMRQGNQGVDSAGAFLNKPAQSTLFGRPLEVQDDGNSVSTTVRIDPSQIQQRIGRDVHPSIRMPAEPERGGALALLEERLVLIVGFFLLLALLVLLVVWLFV